MNHDRKMTVAALQNPDLKMFCALCGHEDPEHVYIMDIGIGKFRKSLFIPLDCHCFRPFDMSIEMSATARVASILELKLRIMESLIVLARHN